MNDTVRFLIAASGIYVCYFYFGYMQETITQGKYGNQVNTDGSKGERFTFALILVAVQCFMSWILARTILCFQAQPEDKTWTGYYIAGAITYLLSMTFANKSLRWINYPTQVVAKAAKPIPVMILSVMLGGRSYSKQKYLFVFTIVVGFIVFMYEDQVDDTKENDHELLGKFLVTLSLLMDGLSGAVQERMRSSTSPTAQHMMLSVNAWSSLFMILAILLTGELFEFLAFSIKHPSVILHLFTFALSSALGQLFIFVLISHFGSLSNSIVTTSRKFFTVLLSLLIFGNSLTQRQWLGTILVFSGLFADMFYGKKDRDKDRLQSDEIKLLDKNKLNEDDV